MRGKKAILGTEIAEFFAYIFFVITVMVFVVIFKLGASFGSASDAIVPENLARAAQTQQAQQLNLLMRTEVTKGKNFADLIVEAVNNDNTVLLQQVAEQQLSKDSVYWRIRAHNGKVYLDPDTQDVPAISREQLFLIDREGCSQRGAAGRFSQILLPNPQNKEVPVVAALVMITNGVCRRR